MSICDKKHRSLAREYAHRMGGSRFVVVGTSGSGKTTMAHAIAERLGLTHVELDALHWGPDWSAASPERFRHSVEQVLSGAGWTVDGNYSRVRDVVWGRADTLVWLDYRFPLVMSRLVRRTVRRSIMGTELWNGNRASIRGALGRDSIVLWAIQTHHRNRRVIPAQLARPEFSHLEVVHLRSPREATRWLVRLG